MSWKFSFVVVLFVVLSSAALLTGFAFNAGVNVDEPPTSPTYPGITVETKEDSVVISFDPSQIEFSVETNRAGFDTVQVENAGQYDAAGEPIMPVFHIRIALPPDLIAKTMMFSTTPISYEPLPIPFEPARAPIPFTDPEETPEGDGGNDSSLEQLLDRSTDDGVYPARPVQFRGLDSMRKWHFSEFVVFPFGVDLEQNQLTQTQPFVAEIAFERDPSFAGPNRNDTFMDDLASEMFTNFDDVAEEYGAVADSSKTIPTLAIVTRQAIAGDPDYGLSSGGGLTGYVDFLNNNGLPTMLIDETVFSGYQGADAAEKAKNWLIANYQNYNIAFVLLVGDPRDNGSQVWNPYCGSDSDIISTLQLRSLKVYPAGVDLETSKDAYSDKWYADLRSYANWNMGGT